MEQFQKTLCEHLVDNSSKHKSKLLFANFVAIIATLISVPIPLLMPLMVDEVLLGKPASGLEMMNHLLPVSLQTPTGYIALTLLLVILMRSASQAFEYSTRSSIYFGFQNDHLPNA